MAYIQSHTAKRYHQARTVWNIRCTHSRIAHSDNKLELLPVLDAKCKQSRLLMEKIAARLKPYSHPSPDKYSLGSYDSKSGRSYSS
jgi:hypothetical protein